jgi:hypothetical protein
MQNLPVKDESPSHVARKPSCSVCWEDFSNNHDLDDHIRSNHPDRVGDQYEIFARAS